MHHGLQWKASKDEEQQSSETSDLMSRLPVVSGAEAGRSQDPGQMCDQKPVPMVYEKPAKIAGLMTMGVELITRVRKPNKQTWTPITTIRGYRPGRLVPEYREAQETGAWLP